MSCCEKCWADAHSDPDVYLRLIKERETKPCTPKQQAGEWWDDEKQVDTRKIEV